MSRLLALVLATLGERGAGDGIRQARRRDWRSLESVFRKTFPDDLPGRALGGRIASGFRNVFILRSAGAIDGFYMISVNRDPSQAWLDYMAVAPTVRRRGLGKALLDHFEGVAVGRGFVRAGLSVQKANEAASALYESNGYKVAEESSTARILVKGLADESAAARAGQLISAPPLVRWMDRVLYAIWVG